MNTYMKNNTITLEEFSKDFTFKDKKLIEVEVLYYDILVALRKLRKKLGLTQKQLAKKASIPRTTISKVESGAYNPTLQTIVNIASAMNKKIKIKLV